MADRRIYNRVAPNQVLDRIDAEYYSKDVMENEDILKGFENLCLENLVNPLEPNNIADLTSNGSFAFLREIQFSSTSGIPYIRTQNVMEGYIDDSELLFVDQDSGAMVSKSQCKTGDLVICRKGKVGAASAIPERLSSAAVSENVTRFSLMDNVDADFLSAFFNSKQGNMRVLRETTGVIQKWINNEKLRQLQGIKLSQIVEKYIGDKVRQAETLRIWAKELKRTVDMELDSIVPDFDGKAETSNRLPVAKLNNRLDPRPYRSHYLALCDALLTKCKVHQIKHIANLSAGDPVPSSIFSEESGIPLIRIRNIYEESFIGLNTFVPKSYAALQKEANARANRIVVGMDGIFRAQFFLEEELPMHINQRIAIIDTHSIRPELLAHWLNRPEGQMQLNQWAVKTTVEHTSLPDIGKIIIPRGEDLQEEKLADRLLSARYSIFLSKILAASSKLLVETFIDGKLTEQDLIAAQQGLAQGDKTLDRKILTRLTVSGVDDGNAPLFTDLNQLYQLLEQANTLYHED